MKRLVCQTVLPLAVLVAVPLAVRAEEADAGAAAAAPEAAAPTEADKAAAKAALQSYLDAVKAKKWDIVKKLTHPLTMARIEDVKKRTKVEDHQMAPWAMMKENYLTEFVLGEPVPSAKGSFAVPSTETRYSVEDKGTEEGVKAEYLVIPVDGKWYVTDRRVGENLFPVDATAAHYKGYFQGEYVPPAPAKKGKK